MSVTRGAFLKSLGKSLPGMMLGSGVGLAAQKILAKVAAVAGEADATPQTTTGLLPPSMPREMLRHGPTTGHQVALTFDDGPEPGVTDRILDTLRDHQAHATFFMIGEKVAAVPDLARRVLAEGHALGNHTYSHARLGDLAEADLIRELEKTQEILGAVLGERAAWFRPPYGSLRADQHAAVRERGMRIVLWNIDPSDWASPAETEIVERILIDVRPGSIILCHDVIPSTAAALPAVLLGLAEKGLKPVTLHKMFG